MGLFKDLLKTSVKVVLAPVYIPYKILKKIDDFDNYLHTPLYNSFDPGSTNWGSSEDEQRSGEDNLQE